MLKPNQKVVKRATETKWSSRHNACIALVGGWRKFLKTLENIENNKAKLPKCSRKSASLRTYF